MQTFISFASDMKLSCVSAVRTKISFSQSLLSGYVEVTVCRELGKSCYIQSHPLSTIVSNLDYQDKRCKTKNVVHYSKAKLLLFT